SIDSAVSHSGKRSYRLSADFTGGGAYVGTWRDLQAQQIQEIRFWAKAEGITRLGIRLADSSEQCHQSSVELKPGADWQLVTLKIRELVGGEHWGGANDGKWHGPAAGFGINIGKEGSPKKTLWIDDVEVVQG